MGVSPPGPQALPGRAATGAPRRVPGQPHAGDRGRGRRAGGDGARGAASGNVWEWTADAFQPYPGFAPDPYADYSAPWFGAHKVLRGGCWATEPRLLRPTWRNFYLPERRDVFAGLRTCAR